MSHYLLASIDSIVVKSTSSVDFVRVSIVIKDFEL